MLHVFLTAAVSFIITFLAIPVIIKVAEQKKLYDLPDARKLHTKPVASLGGVGIFGGFLLSLLLFISSQHNPEFQYYFAAALIIFFLGVKDDILILTATKKFLGQVGAAAILIHLAGIRITSMHGLFGIQEMPLLLSLFVSYITLIVIINAFNLIDGVDGLAGSLGLLTTTIFGAYFFIAEMPAYAMMAFAMAGSLLAFLFFNYNPAKVFMGDTGSLLLGLINSILVIKFINVADTAGTLVPVESAAAVGVSILMLPLADTLRVFSIRIFRGRSPFSPDCNHIHHLLLDRGLSHKHVTLSCFLLNVLFIAIAYFGRTIGATFIMLTIFTICFILFGILFYVKKPLIKPAPKKSFQQHTEAPVHSATKVIPMKKEAVAAD